MKKKNLQKVLSALLCLTMMSTIVGCGNSDEVKESSSTPTEKTTEKESSVEKEEVVEPQEAVELSYFWGNPDNNPDNLPWLEEHLKEVSGATLRYREGDTSVLSTMMASGEICDITVFQQEKMLRDAIDAEMLVNLSEYKDQLPSIFDNELFSAYVNRQEDLFGGVYGLPVNLGSNNSFYNVPNMLWNVYEEIGCPAINNLDDLLNVVKDMMEACPTNAAGEETFGFGMFSEWEGGNGLPFFLGEQGENLLGHARIYNVNTVPADLSGPVEYCFDDGSFEHQLLQFYFKANQMGLLDPDSVIETFSGASGKASSGRYMVYIFGGDVNVEEGTGYKPVLEPVFTLQARPDQIYGGGWWITAANNENVDATIKLLNYIYSYEGQELMANGPEGILYEYNAAGERVMTPAYEAARNELGNTADARAAVAPEEDYLTHQKYVANFYDVITHGTINPNTGVPLAIDQQYPLEPQTKLNQAWYSHYGETTMAEYTDMDKAGSSKVIERAIELTMLPALPDELNEIVATMNPTINEMAYKMIFAKDEAEFDAYWEQLKSDAEAVGLRKVYDYAVDALEEAKVKNLEYNK